MKRNYIGFAKIGNQFGPAEGFGEYTPHLPPGHFKVSYIDYEDRLEVLQFDPKMDEILNLGTKEFNSTLNSVTKFLSPEAAAKFADHGFLLKRSFLFHGPPGTGKSVLASKAADIAIVEKNAIALYPTDYTALERMLEVLDSTDAKRFKVICLEEFDDLVNNHDEASWTTLLDGQFQSSNRMLLATTNNIHNIPQRLLRPGRFSSIIHIPALTTEGRLNYLLSKGIAKENTADIVELTEGFTVDDLKEVVQNAFLLGEDPKEVIAAIRASKNLGDNGEE